MRRGFEDLTPGDRFDICIVGSGPAGLTCAMALSKAGSRVAVVEGGDLEWTDWSQDLYRGEVVGDPFFDLDTARLRHFGGSSGHWAGWCRTFDPHDFKPKGPFDVTSWPIDAAAIAPYLEVACADLEIPASFENRPVADGRFNWVQFQHSPPVRYAEKFGPIVFDDPNIEVFLNTNAESYATDGQRVTGLRVLSNEGEQTQVDADVFILAAGGIENSRILLWSNERTNGALIRNTSALGRYWMEHPQTTVGEVILHDADMLDLDASGFAGFAPEPTLLEQLAALNCTLGITSYNRSDTKRLIADIACVAPDLADWYVGLARKGSLCGARLDVQWEQEPRLENGITLQPETDSLGIPMTRLNWSRSPTDMRTVRAVSKRFGEFLSDNDIGRARLDDWVLDWSQSYPETERIGSHHHMGGTRMAASPDHGVVDSNCKVFGQDNLYIAGSSVFPSGGYTNPTLPIVQLAYRLADHIAGIRK